MNRSIIILLISLLCGNVFSQQGTVENLIAYRSSDYVSGPSDEKKRNLYYSVHGDYRRAVKSDVLRTAKKLSNVFSGYPESWVKDYVSTEIQTTIKGNSVSATGANDILSAKQIELLKTVETGSTINIIVKYKSVNAVTGLKEIRTMNFNAMIIPHVEATFKGGKYELDKYINSNIVDKIYAMNPRNFRNARIIFTVDETGRISNPQFKEKSGNSEVDKLFLEVISNMPDWIPAKENGKGIKQDFEFSAGNEGC